MWLLTELKKRKKEDKPAVICRERCLTYRQLWEQSEQIAQKMLGDLQTKAPILIYGNKNNEIIPVMVAALTMPKPLLLVICLSRSFPSSIAFDMFGK